MATTLKNRFLVSAQQHLTSSISPSYSPCFGCSVTGNFQPEYFYFLGQVSFFRELAVTSKGKGRKKEKKKKRERQRESICCILHPTVAWIRTASSSIPVLISMLWCGTGPFPRDIRTTQKFVTSSLSWGIGKISVFFALWQNILPWTSQVFGAILRLSTTLKIKKVFFWHSFIEELRRAQFNMQDFKRSSKIYSLYTI